MKSRATTLAALLVLAGCSPGGGTSVAPGPIVAAPTPTPSPAPSPTPSPTPTPTPAPTPTPTATSSSYLTFADVYVYRLGASFGLPSTCSGFVLQDQPPAVLPVTPYGQGLGFRFVVTPQVWAISGDVTLSFDGRDAESLPPGTEVAFSRAIGADIVRFSIQQPLTSAPGLVYTRFAALAAPVLGISRQYNCVIGIPTLAADLPSSPSGAFGRTTAIATAYLRDGATARAYTLGRSVVSISADLPAQRVTVSLRLIGTPTGAGGADLDLGTFIASAPIDPATGNFVAPLSSTGRTVTASISGHFFGPQAVEVGAAFGGSVAAIGGVADFTFAGAAYGVR